VGFIDFIVNRSFRDEKEGCVVVFNGVSRGRGYLVRSAGEELRIRAFLKMYLFAEFAIQMLGTLLVAAWLSSLFGSSGRPTLERELTRAATPRSLRAGRRPAVLLPVASLSPGGTQFRNETRAAGWRAIRSADLR